MLKRILKLILPQKLRKKLRWIWTNIHTYIKKRQTIALIPTLTQIEQRVPHYIVSLTSYGKRLSTVAPYAIVTLLNQTVKPDKVILWVGHEDKEKIPKVMEKLIPKGLEIRFCKDIKSYTKLIPAIRVFPNDYIITADDDVYYPQNWFEQLITEHKKNPKKIICHRVHGIKVDENHDPLPYKKWYHRINLGIYPQYPLDSIFPTGVGGILYPPKCFHDDVTNEEFFLKLAPFADDIWFWAMAIINKKYFGGESPYVIIENGYVRGKPIDPNYGKGDNVLVAYNVRQGGNDKQLNKIIEKYPQIKETLRRINPVY